MTDFLAISSVMKMIQEDCETDSAKLDQTPFTPRGMGETFGAMLAMIAAVAAAAESLALEVDRLRDAPPEEAA
jgi:hypothetical protein